MNVNVIKTKCDKINVKLTNGRFKNIWKYRWLYAFMLPGVLFFLTFRYAPMWGLVMAFQDYRPHLGIFGSEWVWLKHFERFFTLPDFWMLFRNTLLLALYDLIIFFPLTILLALMLNEITREWFKKSVQTIVYIPYFLSWVVIVGITHILLSTEGGIVQHFLFNSFGVSIDFLTSIDWFRPLIVMQMVWKDAGWGTIIFLAALTGVNPALYEAARLDGANRLRLIWHITLPSIRNIIIILLILRLGNFLDLGFEQIFLMVNSLNREVGEVFDTYVYRVGLVQGQFSYSAAVGLFKAAVGLVLVVGANWIAKKFGEEGIY
ncbi:ABC transporter permease [Alkalihalobacillus hemicellulosilyticus]|uniref:ABC-type polysaccharide transport system n=1 Tax=Halalkalibacter hemicellulosilyticusJCM 9152 TaxID=1236971 RepID=W4QCP2_9BACI|nr:ABC transporter permease subunit [Halalkalibacter hemicellulosilyticus]GAE29727.1 ABC-type polysaccharide transport system [Halalkalibacter hemicellulosilyticusJCM 9152]